jgi:hypothetical protein
VEPGRCYETAIAKDAITVREPRRDGRRLSARVTTPRGDVEVWYSVSDGEISPYADAFLAATLVPAMRSGLPLRVEAPVSRRLLEASGAIQRTFHSWNRRFKVVPLEAPVREEAGAASGGAACFFSSGVDSFFSVLRHRDELSALIYGKPFDSKIAGTHWEETLDRNVRAAARELGKELVEVETNLRLLWRDWVNWEYFHGAAIMSIALALSPRFSRVYVPPSVVRDQLVPWGSHPDLDPLWGTDEMEFLHVDNDASRFQRVAFISESDVAMRYLQICWEHQNAEYNCCMCEKCLRAMTTLHLLGKLDACPAFPLPLSPEAVASLRIERPHTRGMNFENLRALEATRHDDELAAALRRALKPRRVASATHALRRRWRGDPVG